MVCSKIGVATCINKIESPAHLMHCYGHALQLAVGDNIKAMQMTGTLEAAFELINLSNTLWF